MLSISRPGGNRLPLAGAALLCLTALLVPGCGGGGGGGGSDSGDDPGGPGPAAWERATVRRLAVDGLTTPWTDAVWDAAGRAHVAFFEAAGPGGDPTRPYRLAYVAVDPSAPAPLSRAEPEEVVRLDNCAGLSAGLSTDGKPVVLYQGGAPRACSEDEQSDAMFALRGEAGWEEHTAAIGFVERNPVLPDGLAGSNLAVAADGLGRIHAVYQFFYEGCDSMNFRYPDLRYVRLDAARPDEAAVEETVEGNVYGALNVQNAVGGHAALALDADGEPVVFYAAELPGGVKGLRAARRVEGAWRAEWVEQGCEVGAISAARSGADGSVGVAYAVTSYLDGRDSDHLLRYATRGPSGWAAVTVDDRSRCGEHCSLAYDPQGRPAVAYRELESHTGYALKNLKLARFDGASWATEVVASAGDVGLHNRLRVDADGRVQLLTYSATDQTVYLYRK